MLLEKWVALLAVAMAMLMEATAALPFQPMVWKVGENAVLNCSNVTGEKVEWKWKDVLQPESDPVFLRDNVDIPDTGNYSCWVGSQLLSSFYLAIEVSSDYFFSEKAGEPDITCWTPSYSGTLNCSWKSVHKATLQVSLKRNDTDTLLCPSKEVTVPEDTTEHILLENCSFCPFAEEPPLVLYLEGLAEDGGHAVVRKWLFLQDIVKPDAPTHLNIMGQKISWVPPVSWHLPATYFPLQYNLRLESASSKEDLFLGGLELTTKQENWRKGWIRCKDSFINSSWSSWRKWM